MTTRDYLDQILKEESDEQDRLWDEQQAYESDAEYGEFD
jgi:hypothetical protein